MYSCHSIPQHPHSPQSTEGIINFGDGGAIRQILGLASGLRACLLGSKQGLDRPGLAKALPATPTHALTMVSRWKPAGLVTAWSQEWKGLAPPEVLWGPTSPPTGGRWQQGQGAEGLRIHRRGAPDWRRRSGWALSHPPPSHKEPAPSRTKSSSSAPPQTCCIFATEEHAFQGTVTPNSPTRLLFHSPSVDPESATSLSPVGP